MAEQQFEAAGAFEKGDANLVAFGRSFSSRILTCASTLGFRSPR
jgi:hypothetical protein